MRIGIDIDGVLTNLDEYVMNYLSKYCVENNIEYSIDNFNYKHFKTFNILEDQENDFWNENLESYAKNEIARQFASEVIKRLREEGNEIYILTARWLSNREDSVGENMRNTLISLDGIKEADIECSSAGMCSLTLTKNIDYSQNKNNTYKIIISGLSGGHSGDDIHKNRTNAIKLLADILNNIEDFNLVDINIGTKDNVIPNEGYVIFKSSKELNEITNLLDSLELNLSNDDSNIKINVENVNETEFITQSKDIIDFILNLEDGLLETFKDDNFPLLSSNIGKISLSNNVLEIKLSIRSSDKEKEIEQLNKLKQLCAKYNFNLNLDAQKPFFPFKENSKIREILSETYNELYGKETIIKKVHACMEGGIISSNIKYLDICTIAPTINNCHSINESVSISSTERVYKWLKETLIKFNGR